MKKIAFSFLLLIYIIPYSYSQDLNKIGAAGISFLLNSQSGHNNLSHDEKVALTILGSFLKEESSRQHELEVAKSSSTKVIQSSDGNSVKLIKDTDGNVYLVHNDVAHRISSPVISMAVNESKKNVSDRNLPEFDLKELEKKCIRIIPNSEYAYKNRVVETRFIKYTTATQKIVEEYSAVSSIRKTGTKDYYYDNRGIRILKIPANTQINIAYLPDSYIIKTKLKTTFTCKWCNYNKDIRPSFDNFKQITRTFFTTDNALYLVVNFTNYSIKPVIIEINILNNRGEVVKEHSFNIEKKGDQFVIYEVFIGELDIGSYMYKVKLINDDSNENLLRERFQIIK